MLLSACAPTPEPTPTAAFATEEEAFAAAEETYREYLVAAAARADGDASADPEGFMSGDALESDLESQRKLLSQNLRISGASTIIDFNPVDARINGPVAVLVVDVCLDISASRLLDDNGIDRTPSERSSTGALSVEFTGDAENMLISRSSPTESSQC